MLLALLCGLLYSGARNLRAWLIKPLLNEVLLPQTALARPPDHPLSKLLAEGERGAAPPGPEDPGTAPAEPSQPQQLEAARERLERRVRDELWEIALAGLLVVLVVPLAEFGKTYLLEYTLGRTLVDIQRDVCAKLLSLPLGFHHGTTRGDTLSRTLNDVSRAHRSLDVLFGDVVQSILALAVGLGVLLSISWQLTLVSLVIAPLLGGVVAIFGRRIRRTSRRRQEKVGDVTQRLFEILAGIKVIKVFRAERSEEAAFHRENRMLFRRSMKVVKNRVLARSVTETINNSVAILMLVIGAFLVLKQQWGLTPGDLAAFVAVMATTYSPIKDLAKGWTELMDALPAAERFFELLDARPDVTDAPDAVAIEGVRRGVRFTKVSFSYGREAVLNDVNLEVRAGEVVAIVGRTGAGKTTLADLLLRLYDPDSGAIEIDGIDLRRIRRDSLLDHVAVVTQEPFLFAGTIRDNIRYGRPDASEAEIEAAARAAHVDEFVRELPEGYDTEVGEVGAKLSGGQRQRITIARAILKNPSILIFDEATSSLDAKSERHVQEAIEALLGGRTVFVIAHRLSTIRNADKIMVLEKGVVSRVGSHAELMAGDSLYRELVALQSRDR